MLVPRIIRFLRHSLPHLIELETTSASTFETGGFSGFSLCHQLLPETYLPKCAHWANSMNILLLEKHIFSAYSRFTDSETENPQSGLLPKCLQQPGPGQAKARS